MKIMNLNAKVLLSSVPFLAFGPLLRAAAQDVDVPSNLTMRNSTDVTVGNVLKDGVPFLHNFGTNNTFVGSGAGNFTMSGTGNTCVGAGALSSNTSGVNNAASGFNALPNNTTGNYNIATGDYSLYVNDTGSFNTASGHQAMFNNTAGGDNSAIGANALFGNTTGFANVAIGERALQSNTTGSFNTAVGNDSNVAGANLTNATAIGAGALVEASNKVRLGNTGVTVIEGQVPYTYTSDRNEKENLRPVDAEALLSKLCRIPVTSWNYKGQDAKHFRHYGPMAQDFFVAFGHDDIGTIGTPTSITSGDLDGILITAAQALQRRTAEQEKEIATLRARLDVLERRLRRARNAGTNQIEQHL